MKKLITTILLLFAIMSVTIPSAIAAVQIDPQLHPEYAPVVVLQCPPSNPKCDLSPEYANYFLQLIAGGLLYLAAPTAVLIIAVSGLRYATSHGDENSMEGAKKTLMWAIIGLVVVIGAWAIVRIIIDTIVTKIG